MTPTTENLSRSPENPSETEPAPVPIKLLPHREAPIFNREDGHLIFSQVVNEVLSGNFSLSNTELHSLVRQAGFVSLWFFLHGICGQEGPYERLTNHLHVDMCNYYQASMYPGSRSAFFLPRGMYKTTVITNGANAWEILRDPNIAILITSSITERAYEFMHETQRIFDSSQLVSELYPEYEPSSVWGAKSAIIGNRTRRKLAPTLDVVSAEGSGQGIHANLMKIDDIVGDSDLDSMRNGTASMRVRANWLSSNVENLIQVAERDRIVVAGTRYGIDDPYEFIMNDIRKRAGYWEGIPRTPKPDGTWNVYYRQAEEYGKAIFPAKMPLSRLAKIRDTDRWNYLTQQLNNPYTDESAELVSYQPKKAYVDMDRVRNDWTVTYNFMQQEKHWYVSDCDVVLSCDPAATERDQVKQKTSRTAVVTVITCPDEVRIVWRVRADYIPVNDLYDWLFDEYELVRPRATLLETQGGFKVLGPLLREEQIRRGKTISLMDVPKTGEKIGTIRATLQPLLAQGLLYVTEQSEDSLLEEMASFPAGYKRDILDAVSQGIRGSYVPEDPYTVVEEEMDEQLFMMGRSKVTGY